jgi:pyruvate/2-oxoglutarate dehydrogenase complex dihydrolipoamide dehydrogenase (E3) component
MAEEVTPDLCIIGAGSGGLSIAAAAAALGVPVVLVERGKMGGDCLNTGCVPSKALIAAGKRAETIRNSAPFGVRSQRPHVEFYEVNDHIHGVIGAIAPNDSKQRFNGLGVRVIEGQARFKDAATVEIGQFPEGGSDPHDAPDPTIEIKARKFVIATGSSPAVPPIPGLEQTPYLTNETVFDVRERPKHLIVIGAGPIGLELAQAFRRLGSEVTVLEAAEPLSKEDPECARTVVEALTREGVTIRAGVNVARVRRVRARVEVVLQGEGGEETIDGSDLLIATGRKPNIDGLNLDAAGIKSGRGGIAVDKRLRTTNKRVYAIGDVAGGQQFTHVANYHAGLVVRHALFHQPVTITEDNIPRVTFTDPELAHVGLSELQARERYRRIRVLRWPYHENDRAQTERATAGHIKVITDRKGNILGATIVGSGAGELITSWTLAVGQGLNIRAFAELVVPYPTFAEIGKRAAIGYFAPKLKSPWVRRLLGVLRWFG